MPETNESKIDIGKVVSDIAWNIPYNNFRNILLAQGVDCPNEIGGNCHYTNRLLNEALGGNLTFLRLEDSDHTCALYESDDGPFLLDPSLRILEPIPLKALLDGTESVILKPALPQIKGNYMTMVVRRKKKNKIEMQRKYQDPETGALVVDDSYILNVKRKVKLPAPDDYDMISIQDNNPVISVPTADGRFMVLKQLPPHPAEAQIGGGNRRTEIISGERITEIIEAISKIIGLEKAKLLAALQQGSTAYLRKRQQFNDNHNPDIRRNR